MEQRGNIQSRLANYKNELKEVSEILGNTAIDISKKHMATIQSYYKGETLMILTIKKIENSTTKTIKQELTKQERALSSTDRKLGLAMQKFINPVASVSEKYPNWMAETIDF